MKLLLLLACLFPAILGQKTMLDVVNELQLQDFLTTGELAGLSISLSTSIGKSHLRKMLAVTCCH
jgi:uncharacterized protein (UPF0264 family)